MNYKKVLGTQDIAFLCSFKVFDIVSYNISIAYHFLDHAESSKDDEKCIK